MLFKIKIGTTIKFVRTIGLTEHLQNL